jgi:hypothetical protein
LFVIPGTERSEEQSGLVEDGSNAAGHSGTVAVTQAPETAHDEPIVEGEELEADEAR